MIVNKKNIGLALILFFKVGSSISAASMDTTYFNNSSRRVGGGIAEKIFVAARLNDVELLRKLVAAPFLASISLGFYADTPLHAAAEKGHLESVLFLLQMQANVFSRKTDGCIPLHLACSYKDWDRKKEDRQLRILDCLLLENPTQVLIQNCYGNTPLHYVAMFGTQKMADLLLKFGADLSIRNNENLTAEELHRFSNKKPFIDFKKVKSLVDFKKGMLRPLIKVVSSSRP